MLHHVRSKFLPEDLRSLLKNSKLHLHYGNVFSPSRNHPLLIDRRGRSSHSEALLSIPALCVEYWLELAIRSWRDAQYF